MTEDPIRSLYESTPYPALSYPSCDPSVMAVAAKMAGINCPLTSESRVLEIGCSSGHHLLHLAARWPGARFTGVDFSSKAIKEARAAAEVAGLNNIEFHRAALEDFESGGQSYDFVVAHGFYSWVPHEVRDSLMARLPALLGRTGIAAIGYNTLPGWSLRRPVGEILRKWSSLPDAQGTPPTSMLEQLEKACPHDTYGVHMRALLQHMRTQGASTLLFDDLPECNHPCTFTDFFEHAKSSGLRYLGEADIAHNLPASLGDEELAALSPLASDPIQYQQALDVFSGRSHRVSLVSSSEVAMISKPTETTPLELAIRTEHKVERDSKGVSLRHSSRPGAHLSHPMAVALFEVLAGAAPCCVSMQDVLEQLGDRLGPSSDLTNQLPALASLVLDAARRGLVLARIEPVEFSSKVPERPCLSPLRLHSVQQGKTLVDAFHTPLVFSEAEYKVLSAMDGSRTPSELERVSAPVRSGASFHQWLASLARHGVFE